jgi:hypothetical protein
VLQIYSFSVFMNDVLIQMQRPLIVCHLYDKMLSIKEAIFIKVPTFLHRLVFPLMALNNQTSVEGSGKNYKLINFVIYNFQHYVQINYNVICCENVVQICK